MINKRNKARRILTVLLVLIIPASIAFLVLCLVIRANLEQVELFPLNSSYQDTGNYRINPETILEALDQGKTNIFTPILTASEAENTPNSVGLYPWKQSDYLKVASALRQFIWKDNLENWRLYSMYFYRGCQDNPIGFDSGEMTYFKARHGLFSYTTRVIDIYPSGGEVSWGGGANFPRSLSGWTSLNLESLTVTADNALQIAEENGGKEFRLKVENACTIDVFINPNPDSSNDEDWIVYYNNMGYSVFEMHINPYTSEIKVLDGNQ